MLEIWGLSTVCGLRTLQLHLLRWLKSGHASDAEMQGQARHLDGSAAMAEVRQASKVTAASTPCSILNIRLLVHLCLPPVQQSNTNYFSLLSLEPPVFSEAQDPGPEVP